MLLPWPLQEVDGQLLCLAVQDFLTRFCWIIWITCSLGMLCGSTKKIELTFFFPGCGTRFSLS